MLIHAQLILAFDSQSLLLVIINFNIESLHLVNIYLNYMIL